MSSPEFEVIVKFIEELGFETQRAFPYMHLSRGTWETSDMYGIEIKDGILEIEEWAQSEMADRWIPIASIPLGDPNCFSKLERVLIKNKL